MLEVWFEHELWDALCEEGLSVEVVKWYQTTAMLNDRCTAYFIIMALEGFKTHMDQQPGIDIDSVLN